MKRIYFAMISIVGISTLFLYFGLPYLEQNWTQDSYLLYGILVIEVLGIFAYRSFQLKDKREGGKIGHTERLLEKILKPLQGIEIMLNRDGNYGLVISKIPNLEYRTILQAEGKPTNDNFYTLDKLPYPYYDWAKLHIKKYANLKNIITELEEFTKKQNNLNLQIRILMNKKIRSELNNLFPKFVEYASDSSMKKSIYLLPEIREICEVYNQYKKVDPIRIHNLSDGTFTLCSNHNGRRYLISEDKMELDHSKFMQLLKNVDSDTQINQTRKKLQITIYESISATNLFKTNLALLVEELDTGDVQIKGTCKGCS